MINSLHERYIYSNSEVYIKVSKSELENIGTGNIQIDYNDLDNLPTLVTNHSDLNLDDGTNPHGTTKADVGLGNVDNTSDLDKPISTATQTALDSKLDKDTTAGVERAYIINADGSQGTKATSEFGGGEIYIKNISVSGGYTVDFNVDTHRLTLTGNTTFSEINLPPVGFSKTITLHINGNFGVVFPASWTQYISGAYNGTATLNTIVIETIGTERKVQISQPN